MTRPAARPAARSSGATPRVSPRKGRIAPEGRSRRPTFPAVQPDGWRRPRGYSNGIVVPPGHALLHTAGMVGWDERERIVPGFVAQFERALANVLAVVRHAGGGPEHVVSMTVYVVDRAEYLASLAALGDAWRRTMGRNYPAMALVAVAGLVEDGARLEIQAVAALPVARP